jgi:hypothetical protein
MTEAQIARFLIEDLPAQLSAAYGKDVPEKVKVLFNRMMLQAFSVPSLQSYLQGASVEKDPNNPNGVRIQLDFLKLPREVIPDLERLLSVDYFKNHRLVRFMKNGSARTGLEISVEPKDLPGDAYDYAF